MVSAIGESALKESERRSIIVGVLTAMLLAALDQTIVAPALPTIGAKLGIRAQKSTSRRRSLESGHLKVVTGYELRVAGSPSAFLRSHAVSYLNEPCRRSNLQPTTCNA